MKHVLARLSYYFTTHGCVMKSLQSLYGKVNREIIMPDDKKIRKIDNIKRGYNA